jgi:hypothetical protein
VHGVAEHGEGSGLVAPVVHSEVDAEAPFVDGFAHAEEFWYSGGELLVGYMFYEACLYRGSQFLYNARISSTLPSSVEAPAGISSGTRRTILKSSPPLRT